MIKRLVFGVAAGALPLAPLSARADWFVNPEINIGVGTETGVGGAVTDLHVGYEFKNGAQVGPSLVTPDTGDSTLRQGWHHGGPLYVLATGDTETTGNVKIGAPPRTQLSPHTDSREPRTCAERGGYSVSRKNYATHGCSRICNVDDGCDGRDGLHPRINDEALSERG